MADKLDDARLTVAESLEQLRMVHTRKPNSFNVKLFFNAKVDELVKKGYSLTVISRSSSFKKKTSYPSSFPLILV